MPQYYFLHIPKTAGQTLSYSVLNQHFAEAEIFPAFDYSGFFKSEFRHLAEYRLFRGHFYHFFVRLLREKPTIFTFLRNPIERTISDFEYVRRETTHHLHRQLALFGSVGDWISHPRFFCPNSMVALLAADLDPFSFVTRISRRFGVEEDLDAAITSHVFSQHPGRDELERAKERLASYAFVGLTERFDESVELLRHTFHWSGGERQKDWNVARERTRLEELPSATQALLMRTHELDWELYRFAEELFESRLKVMRNSPFPSRSAQSPDPQLSGRVFS